MQQPSSGIGYPSSQSHQGQSLKVRQAGFSIVKEEEIINFEVFVKQAIVLTETIQDPTIKVKVLAGIAEAQVNAGNLSQAQMTLLRAEKILTRSWLSPIQQVESILPFAHSQAMSGNLAGSWKNLKTASDLAMTLDAEGTDWALSKIGQEQILAQDFSGAARTIERIQKKESNTQLFEKLGIRQAQAGDFRGAQETAAAVQNTKIKSSILASVVKEVVTRGELEAAELIATTIEESSILGNGLRTIAEAYLLAGNLPRAMAVTSRIPFVSLPERIRYSPPSLVYKEEYGPDQAKAEIQMLIGDQESAFKTIQTVRDPISKSHLLISLAELQEQSGDKNTAKQTFQLSLQNIVTVKNNSDLQAIYFVLIDLAQSQGRHGDIPGAYKTLDHACHLNVEIKDPLNRSKVFTDIIETLVQLGDLARAFEVATSLKDDWKYRAYSKIASAQAEKGDRIRAKEIFQLVRRSLAEKSNRHLVLQSLVEDQTLAGLWEDALETLDFLSDGKEKAFALLRLLQAQITLPDKSGVHTVLPLALSSAKLIQDEDGWSRDNILSQLSRIQMQAGDLPGALETVDSLSGENEKAFAFLKLLQAQMTLPDKSGVHTVLPLALSSAKLVQDEDGWSREDIFGQLSRIQLQTGDLQGAIKTATSLPENGEQTFYFGELSKDLVLAEKFGDALQLIEKIPGELNKGAVLWEAVLFALKEQKIQTTRELFEVDEILFGGDAGRAGAGMFPARPKRRPTSEVKLKHAKTVSVYYGTDRAPSKNNDAVQYGAQRGSALRWGVCNVSIPTDPKVHTPGNLESPFWLAQTLGVSKWFENIQKHIVLLSIQTKTKEAFLAELQQKIGQSNEKDAFVFIHGFNMSFADACRRTAQLSHDLKFTGAPILYSWPSQAQLNPIAYMTDEDSVKRVIPHLKNFLNSIQDNSGAETIHLIAHSMGNRALVWTLKDIANDLEGEKDLPVFNQIVLTAPDIDAEVFADLAKEIQRTARRTTLYSSSNDKALIISKNLHGGVPSCRRGWREYGAYPWH